MNKKLGILGHPTRGEEIIEILKALGGKYIEDVLCEKSDRFYHVSPDDKCVYWNYYDTTTIDGFVIFSLEEFLRKYPFKVGDKVVYTKYGDNCDDYPVTIESMRWTGTTIEYTFDDCVTCLAKDLKMWNSDDVTPYKEEVNAKDNKLFGTLSNPVEFKSFTVGLKDGKVIDNSVDAAQFMQFGKTVAVCFNTENYENEVELQLGDYEIEVRDGKTYAVLKKPVYPKTYVGCCYELSNCDKYGEITAAIARCSYKGELITAFTKLLICRDAYWKIAGEHMSLGKPWEPNWADAREVKYSIEPVYGSIDYTSIELRENRILVFPTDEMRTEFYYNFKDLIESCKELL